MTPRSNRPHPTPLRRTPRALLAAAVGLAALAMSEARADGTDLLRTTVQVRNGNNRGSGTILASAAGSTLVLTAAHVVRDGNDLKVELHRHNFGSRTAVLTEGNGWPRLVAATVAAIDPDTDVALLRVRGMVALPHVARFDPAADEPAKGEVLTSVGIDRTLHLTLWRTSAEGTARIDLGRGKGARRFTVTNRAPEHGRSGGGLFRANGTVAGVCTGQLTIGEGPKHGAFASVESIRNLLRDAAADARAGPP